MPPEHLLDTAPRSGAVADAKDDLHSEQPKHRQRRRIAEHREVVGGENVGRPELDGIAQKPSARARDIPQ